MHISQASNETIFNSSLSIGSLQKFMQKEQEKYESNEQLTLNLEKVTFIELPALVQLFVVIYERILHDQKTLINLPKDKRARNFFRVWQFPEAIKKLTGISLYSLSTTESKRYFGEKYKEARVVYLGNTKYDLNDLLPKNMVAMTLYSKDRFSESSSKHLADKISEMWESNNVKLVFERLFKKNDNKFSENIVYEAIANSLRHPQCNNILVCSSIFSGKELKHNDMTPDGYFTLVLWDDGESIIETLFKKTQLKESVRNWYHEIFDNINYKLKVKSAGNTIKKDLMYKSNFEPDQRSDKDEIFLASILPGISSKPEKLEKYHHRDRVEEILRKPGMGLYLLTITSLHHFKGTVAIRSGDRFLSIKAGKLEDDELFRFDCSIERDLPYFQGNMITIRLPILEL